MTNSFNVIGDIAGNYKTLMALIEKMPKGKIIAVGDIIDRGPRSKEVVEYFMNADKTGEAECLMGNHEHMCIDHFSKGKKEYSGGIWTWNGGETTLESYKNNIPEEVLNFLKTRKIDLTLDLGSKKCYISHAFRPLGRDLDEEETEFQQRLWNRRPPWFNSQTEDIQICGHNSQYGLRYWDNGNVDIYGEKEKQAICIDTSRDSILTGIHLPSMTIYQQEYID